LFQLARFGTNTPADQYPDSDSESSDYNSRPTTPWVRTVVSGVDLLRNAKYAWISTIDGDDDETRRLARSLRACSISLRCFRYNKGLGFTEGERDRLYLRGLLPPAVLSQDVQAERVLTNLNNMISCVACCSLLAAR